MSVYRKKGGKRINYSSKRISHYLKPSQQDDGSEQHGGPATGSFTEQHGGPAIGSVTEQQQHGGLAIGSSTEQHGGPATGSSMITRSKKRGLDDVIGASAYLPVDTHTRGGKVRTGAYARDYANPPVDTHTRGGKVRTGAHARDYANTSDHAGRCESRSDAESVPNSRRDPTAEGNAYHAERYDSQSRDPNRVIPDTDMSDYDNWPSDGDMPDGNAGNDDCGDPEKVISDSHMSASKESDGGIPDDDWRLEQILSSDDEGDWESEDDPITDVGSNSDVANGDDPTRVQVGEDRIRQALRVTIQIIKDEAVLMSSSSQRSSSQRAPMTLASAKFFKDHSVEELVKVWMPGFSKKFKALFAKDQLSLQDLLDLPLAELDTRTGIYLLIAVLKTVAVGGYIGSASGQKGIKQRDGQHTRQANPSATEKGLLYDLLRTIGIVKQNRVLASFAPPLPYRKHLVMLEGILSVWFSTLVKPTKDRRFFTESGWRICENIRSAIDIPSVPAWEPLNEAFQLQQGYIEVPVRTGPCTNCGTTETRQWYRGRSGWDKQIVGKCLCNACYLWAVKNKGGVRPKDLHNKPDQGRVRPEELYNKPGPLKGPCTNCGTIETCGWRYGKEDWDQQIAGKCLCNACFLWAATNKGGVRPEELYNKPEPLDGPCTNCGTTETCRWNRGSKGWDEQIAGKCICNACYVWAESHKGGVRPKYLNEPLDGPCTNCGTTETRHWCRGKEDWDEQIAGKCLCTACWSWAQNNQGRVRPEELYNKPGPLKGPCTNCGRTETYRWYRGRKGWHEQIAGKCLCNTCYSWATNNKGGVRPTDVRRGPRKPLQPLNV